MANLKSARACEFRNIEATEEAPVLRVAGTVRRVLMMRLGDAGAWEPVVEVEYVNGTLDFWPLRDRGDKWEFIPEGS